MHLSPTVAWLRARACLGLSLAAPRSMTLSGEHERVSLSRRRAEPLWAPRPGLPRPARGRPLTVPPSQPRALFCGPHWAPSPRPRSLPWAPHPCLPFAPPGPRLLVLFPLRATSGLQPRTFALHVPAPHFLQPLALASPFGPRANAPSPSPPLSPMVSSFPSLCAPPGPRLLRCTSPWAPPCPQSPHPIWPSAPHPPLRMHPTFPLAPHPRLPMHPTFCPSHSPSPPCAIRSPPPPSNSPRCVPQGLSWDELP